MIVTNFIAEKIIKIASWFTPGTDAVTIWPCIFCKSEYKDNAILIRHESVHLKQWIKYGWFGFPFVYIYQYIKYGYDRMPLENSAREAEKI